jgi:hypothetical protein
MTQLRAKQIFFANEGELLVGGAGTKGVYLPKGSTGNSLRVIDGSLSWTSVDKIENEGAFVATSMGSIVLAPSEAGLLTITADNNSVSLTANSDIHLKPKAGGEVIIGEAGGGVIQSDDNEDLTILGGAGAGNLFLMHGGSGKLFYATDASDPLREVATLGDVKAALTAARGRAEFLGDAAGFVVPSSAVLSSVEVFINGLIAPAGEYSVNPTSREVTFDAAKIGYEFDAQDTIVFLFNAA